MRLLALAAGAAALAAAQQCALGDSQKYVSGVPQPFARRPITCHLARRPPPSRAIDLGRPFPLCLQDCYPWGTANQTVCLAHGCCWNPTSSPGVAWCYYPQLPTPSSAQCAAVTVPSRIDCHPEPNADQPSCEARGCCWSPYGGAAGSGVKGVAACYFPHTDGYTAGPKLPTSNGFTANLALGSQAGPYRNDITPLVLNVEYRTSNTLRFTIGDPNSDRWVPPVPLEPAPGTPPAATDYSVAITQAPEPFGITVTRTSTGSVLFDSRVAAGATASAASKQQAADAAAARHGRVGGVLPPRDASALGTAASGVVTNGLVFEDQYLEISSALPVSGAGNVSSGGVYVYGLVRRRRRRRRRGVTRQWCQW